MEFLCVEAPGLLQEPLYCHGLDITISVLCYCGLLRELHITIKRKHTSLFTRSRIMLQDDHPLYIPDLLLYALHVFCPLKRAFKNHKFGPNEDVKAVTMQLFEQQPGEFLQK
jgi:hypothetical protein